MLTAPILALLLPLAAAHGDHSFDLDDHADEGLSYAERHMHTEHHIDSFDLPSFFKLHDLDMDGFWSEAEIQAVYGLRHESGHHHGGHGHDGAEAGAAGEGIVEKRAKVVKEVLLRLDSNGDGKISLAEYVMGGTDGLPSFAGYKDLGHHYDEESEYFLHHEELYHSTPETQTDESYNHPEDIEHFKNHHHIEDKEDARERVFQGLDPHADLEQDHVIVDPLDQHAHAPGEGPADAQGQEDAEADTAQHAYASLKAGDAVPPPPPLRRASPGAQPNRITPGQVRDARRDELREAKERVGGAEHDPYHVPRTPEDRLRAGVPYKYKWVFGE